MLSQLFPPPLHQGSTFSLTHMLLAPLHALSRTAAGPLPVQRSHLPNPREPPPHIVFPRLASCCQAGLRITYRLFNVPRSALTHFSQFQSTLEVLLGIFLVKCKGSRENGTEEEMTAECHHCAFTHLSTLLNDCMAQMLSVCRQRSLNQKVGWK